VRLQHAKAPAGIHDAVWVENLLELAHQLQFERRLVALDFIAFQLTSPCSALIEPPKRATLSCTKRLDHRRILDKNIRSNPSEDTL